MEVGGAPGKFKCFELNGMAKRRLYYVTNFRDNITSE
jgi:hypothetical protein